MSDTSPKNQDALLPGYRPPSTAPMPRRGDEIWRLAQDGHALVCELLDDSDAGAGYEVRLRKDDELVVGTRCVTRGIAAHVAEVCRQDHLRTGWAASSTTT
jgi:hypothetical protein